MDTKQQKGCYWCVERKKMRCTARNYPLLNGLGNETSLKAYGDAVGGECTLFNPKSKKETKSKVIFS